MILKNTSFDEFMERINLINKRLVIFGAGVLSHVFLHYIQVQSKNIMVDFIMDNDVNKIGKKVSINGYEYDIRNIEVLKKVYDDDIIILICSSYYYEIVQQLDIIKSLGQTECYILPLMFVTHKNIEQKVIFGRGEKQIIPKKIHYMWFGSKKLPERLQRCVDSWKKFCPDYEIIFWNENNYDINTSTYTKQAYEHKAWGFIPDYARIDILYHHGGIYMDTDVELLKNLDEMLYQPAFACVEKWQVINMGGCSGAVPYNDSIKKILDVRKDITFINNDGSINRMASGYYDTAPFINEGYLLNGKNQEIGGLNIYTFDYFHPFDYMTGQTHITNNTFGIHHFNGSWISEDSIKERIIMQNQYFNILKRMEND